MGDQNKDHKPKEQEKELKKDARILVKKLQSDKKARDDQRRQMEKLKTL
jgi:hypothetical protein